MPMARRRCHTYSTELTLLKITQRCDALAVSFSIRSRSELSSRGPISIAGSSTASAPIPVSNSINRDAWVRERVTSARLPQSGRRSNQPISSRNPATSPITTITGAPMPACRPRSTILARLPVTVRWRLQVPHCTNATGVSADIPLAFSVSTIPGRVAQPINATRVPPVLARAAQSVLVWPLVGSSLPVTMVTEVEMPRWVTGMPA